MSVWAAPSVEDQPHVVLSDWFILEVLDKPGDERYGYHLCGYHSGDYEGRVTSKLASYDREKGIITTRSGRQYTLSGEAFLHSGEAQYVMHAWLRANQVDEYNALDFIPDTFRLKEIKECAQ